MAKLIRVGIGSRNYTYRRVAYELPVSDVVFHKPLYLPWKFLRRDDPRLANTYFFVPGAAADLFHLWNGICLNRRPWITSFEAHLPRYGRRDGWWIDLALRRLHDPSCRGLLAMSDYARHFFFEQNAGRLDQSVRDKVEVLRGMIPVDERLLARRAAYDPAENSRFVLCFVGHAFFQKGGMACVEALRQLTSARCGVELIVISRVEGGDFVTGFGPEEAEQMKRVLSGTPGIVWKPNVPHHEVLRIMCDSHVVLLPSFDDTLGWSVLEAMSVGTPVITTNVCALPESVINGVTGFTIDLPLDQRRRWAGLGQPQGSDDRKRAVMQATGQIADGVRQAVQRLMDSPDLWRRMSAACVEFVRKVHDPGRLAARLRRIYEMALS